MRCSAPSTSPSRTPAARPSPDATWLTVAEGFAQHVRKNAAALRSRLVAHQGNERIEVAWDGPMPSDAAGWTAAVELFRNALTAHIGDGRARLLECDFSTTGEVERTASRIVLMDAYSPYFDYFIICVCGIPSITLLGTVDDWRRIRARIHVLDEFDCGFWTASLAPYFDEFVAAAEGNARPEFWKRIYRTHRRVRRLRHYGLGRASVSLSKPRPPQPTPRPSLERTPRRSRKSRYRRPGNHHRLGAQRSIPRKRRCPWPCPRPKANRRLGSRRARRGSERRRRVSTICAWTLRDGGNLERRHRAHEARPPSDPSPRRCVDGRKRGRCRRSLSSWARPPSKLDLFDGPDRWTFSTTQRNATSSACRRAKPDIHSSSIATYPATPSSPPSPARPHRSSCAATSRSSPRAEKSARWRSSGKAGRPTHHRRELVLAPHPGAQRRPRSRVASAAVCWASGWRNDPRSLRQARARIRHGGRL